MRLYLLEITHMVRVEQACPTNSPHKVDIQSPTAELRQGNKKRGRNHSMKTYMACPITQGGHKLV